MQEAFSKPDVDRGAQVIIALAIAALQVELGLSDKQMRDVLLEITRSINRVNQ